MLFRRSLPALLLLATISSASPVPASHHDAVTAEHPRGLIESVLSLTESRLDLRDAAFAILDRANVLPRSPDEQNQLGKRWQWYFPRPRPRPGIEARDQTSQIAQLLAELQQSFAALAQLISEQLDIPLPSTSKQVAPSSTCTRSHSHTLTTTTTTSLVTPTPAPSMQPDHPVTPPPQPLTTAQAPLTSLGPPTLANLSSSSAPAQPPASVYSFDPNRKDLNVVYYAQSPATTSVPFPNLCNDPAIDIIILSFVTDFFTVGGYPTLNLASKCWGLDPNTPLGIAAKAKGATGLIDCVSPGFASQVAQCQASGKKVMLSLGGAIDYSNTAIPSDQKAVELANTLWSLFLGGTAPNLTPLRPFGSVVLDGIDIDNENPANSAHIPTLVATLRTLYRTGSKPFYLGAAPQCPRPDLSIPISSMLPYLDFISVQFYNNPSCNLDSTGFISSLRLWSSDIANYRSFNNIANGFSGPKLLIGAPADPAAAGAGGYVSQATWRTILQQVKGLSLGNLGGAMYWDGSYLELGKTGGKTFADVVRDVL